VCVCVCVCVCERERERERDLETSTEAVYKKCKYRNYIKNEIGVFKQSVELFKTLYSQNTQFSITACSVLHGQTV